MKMISVKKAKQFMELAEFKATLFSKDTATQVCAIIVAPNSLQELSSGWNGMPRGINESIESRSERPIKYHWYEHAERNAIYNASRRGTPLEGSIMFVNRYPCSDCARAIIQCGISMVITVPYDLNHIKWTESWNIASEMLAESGISVVTSDLVPVSHVMFPATNKVFTSSGETKNEKTTYNIESTRYGC